MKDPLNDICLLALPVTCKESSSGLSVLECLILGKMENKQVQNCIVCLNAI